MTPIIALIHKLRSRTTAAKCTDAECAEAERRVRCLMLAHGVSETEVTASQVVPSRDGMAQPTLCLPNHSFTKHGFAQDTATARSMLAQFDGPMIHRTYFIFDTSAVAFKLGPVELKEQAARWIAKSSLVIKRPVEQGLVDVAIPEEAYERAGLFP